MYIHVGEYTEATSMLRCDNCVPPTRDQGLPDSPVGVYLEVGQPTPSSPSCYLYPSQLFYQDYLQTQKMIYVHTYVCMYVSIMMYT